MINDENDEEFIYTPKGKLSKILYIIHLVYFVIGVLMISLTFVQSTHLMGFIYGVILTILSGLLLICIKINSKSGKIRSRKHIFIALTAILGLFFLWVLVVFSIRLLNFIRSPRLKLVRPSSLEESIEAIQTTEISQQGFYTNYDSETGNIIGNLAFPTHNVYLSDVLFDLDKFVDCAGEGGNTRVQRKELGDNILSDPHLLVHVNTASNWLGLIQDRLLYLQTYETPTPTTWLCLNRITRTSFSTSPDCIQSLIECVIEASE
ncbi:unnamed protein product [Moneuplotes crassus]|uniref:Uncharacterized protein n=1 Tax=Euplotes crassus TaxID=5936 RepID=A0AAD1UF65_EUPCR|nr:unnamed protein product [Moneuplotes crassus]